MPHAGVYVLAGLVSGVSAALILAGGPSYTEARSQGIAYNVKRGQSTYNACRTSPCQSAHLNSVEDFCLWAPSQPVLSATRNTEHTLDAWCMKSAHGTRLIPDGTISGACLVITPEYVQITGVGNLTNINIPADGVASASGEADRVHGLVFTRAYGQLEQIYDWTSFVSQERFCFRACKPSAAASTACPRIHDSFGCLEGVPGKYDTGVSEDYIGDATEVPLTLYQEGLAAPSHYSARPPSGCMTRDTISNAQVARARRAPYWLSGSYRHNTPLTSSIPPTTTDTATMITLSSLPTSTLTATTFMASSTPISSATPTSTPHSYGYTYTHTHWHSRTNRHSRHRFSTSSASVPSSSSYYSLSHSRSSSSTASSSLPDPFSTTSASSPASSTSSSTLIFSTYSFSDPSSSGTSTLTSTPTLPPAPTPSFPSSSDGRSSSLSERSSAQTSSSPPSSTTTPTSSLTSPSIPSLTSSQSSDVLTFTTSLSSTTVPATSSVISSPTLPNSQTQISTQCPPLSQVAVNAGSVVPSPAPLFSLMLAILMVVVSSSVGVLVP